MKSLLRFIKESFETFRIKNIEITYNCKYNDNNKICYHIPNTYSEDDFQIYLQDMYLEQMPGNTNNAEKFFGKNQNNIYDELFDYEKYEKSENKLDNVIEWNSEDKSHNPDNEEFAYVTITNLKYILKFDEFELKDYDSTDIKNILKNIFKRCESNDINKYPIDLVLDETNIKYTE